MLLAALLLSKRPELFEIIRLNPGYLPLPSPLVRPFHPGLLLLRALHRHLKGASDSPQTPAQPAHLRGRYTEECEGEAEES